MLITVKCQFKYTEYKQNVANAYVGSTNRYSWEISFSQQLKCLFCSLCMASQYCNNSICDFTMEHILEWAQQSGNGFNLLSQSFFFTISMISIGEWKYTYKILTRSASVNRPWGLWYQIYMISCRYLTSGACNFYISSIVIITSLVPKNLSSLPSKDSTDYVEITSSGRPFQSSTSLLGQPLFLSSNLHRYLDILIGCPRVLLSSLSSMKPSHTSGSYFWVRIM